jgi:2Fe-2S ferredoxin
LPPASTVKKLDNRLPPQAKWPAITLKARSKLMALIKVTDRDGNEHDVDGNTRFTLMENLRDLEYGVAAVCGGMCACATCHVYVDPEWQGKLPAQHSDEKDLLQDLSTYRPGASRLSCQIKFTEALAGLKVTIADDE